MEVLHIQKIIDGCLVNNQPARELLFRQVYTIGYPFATYYAAGETTATGIVENAYLYILDNLPFYDNTKNSFKSWVRQVIIDKGLESNLPTWKAVYNLQSVEGYNAADISSRLNISPAEVKQFYDQAVTLGGGLPQEPVVLEPEQVSAAWEDIAPVVDARYSSDESVEMPRRASAKQRIANGGWIGWAILIALCAMALMVLAKTGTMKGNKIKITKPKATHVAVGPGYNLPCPNH